MSRAIPPILFVLLALGQTGLARADAESSVPLAQGWAIGFTGGVQKWTMTGLEEAVDLRHAASGAQGYDLKSLDFDWAPSFGAEISYRFASRWLVRAQAEWVRHTWEDRDGRTVWRLGGGRDFVSIGETMRVETNFAIASLGVGRVHGNQSVAFTWAVGGVIAPIEVKDSVHDTVEATDSIAPNDVTATGIGFGAEGVVTLDYPAHSSSTVFLEGLYRFGATEVELDDPAWAGTFTPLRRKVDFTGYGFRLGLRWS